MSYLETYFMSAWKYLTSPWELPFFGEEKILLLFPWVFCIAGMLCVVFVLSWIFHYKRRKKFGLIPGSIEEDLYDTFGKKTSRQSWLEFFILVFLGCIFVLLMSYPVHRVEETHTSQEGIDIVLVFDISYSMLSIDMEPNRMHIAKEVTLKFIDALNSDRLGIILFAGVPFVAAPLTFDYDLLREYIQSSSDKSIDQQRPGLSGTAIGDALLTAIDLLNQEEKNLENQQKKETTENENQKKTGKREKVIILMTDGEANKEREYYDPITVAQFAKENNIKIYSVGIGSTEPGPLIIRENKTGRKRMILDYSTGQVLTTKLDEETLQKISRITGGEYYNASDKEAFQKIFEKLSKIPQKPIETQVVHYDFPAYHHVLIIFLIIGFLSFLIVRTHKKIIE